MTEDIRRCSVILHHFFVWGFVFMDSLEWFAFWCHTEHSHSRAPARLCPCLGSCSERLQVESSMQMYRYKDCSTAKSSRALMSYETVLNVNERGSYFKTNNMLGCFPKAVANRLSKVTVPPLLATLWASSGISCVAGGLHLVWARWNEPGSAYQ